MKESQEAADPSAPLSGRLIAFCGIDGAGKSSLVDRLERDGAVGGAVFLRKARKTTVNLVTEYGPTDEGGRRNWIEGPFAENAAAATAIDFLHHYDEQVAPRLAAGEWVVCDRYALCYEAYLLAVGSRFRFGNIFGRLRRPDLLIYVDAPVTVVVQRHRLRGGATEDEHPEVMRRYRAAYLSLLDAPDDGSTFILNNEGPFEQTYEHLRRRVGAQVSRWV